jgi:hypothetical protein
MALPIICDVLDLLKYKYFTQISGVSIQSLGSRTSIQLVIVRQICLFPSVLPPPAIRFRHFTIFLQITKLLRIIKKPENKMSNYSLFL